MKIVTNNAVLLKNEDPLKVIEYAGRTCYKSLENITDDSAIDFCSKMKKSKHYAMLEHGILHLLVDIDQFEDFDEYTEYDIDDCFNLLAKNDFKYFNVTFLTFFENNKDVRKLLITGSFRAFLEYLDSEEYQTRLCKAISSKLGNKYPEIFNYPGEYSTTDYVTIVSDSQVIDILTNYYLSEIDANFEIQKHIYHTIVFTCDRGVSHEFVRHRPASFAQESTRYCNYSREKFGNEITVVLPVEYKDQIGEKFDIWKSSCEFAEKSYFALVERGATPQEARGVLPTDLKTEIVITANEIEWQHIINLRFHGTTGKPHPHMLACMDIAYPILCSESNNRLS